MIDFLKGWKTLIFNSLIAFLGGLQAADFVDVLDPQYIPLAVAIVAVINIILRLVSNTPAGSDLPAQK